MENKNINKATLLLREGVNPVLKLFAEDGSVVGYAHLYVTNEGEVSVFIEKNEGDALVYKSAESRHREKAGFDVFIGGDLLQKSTSPWYILYQLIERQLWTALAWMPENVNARKISREVNDYSEATATFLINEVKILD